MKYAEDGGFLVTLVSETDPIEGIFAPDGSLYVTEDVGLGLYAPNKSIRINTSGGTSSYDPNGSWSGILSGNSFTPYKGGGGSPSFGNVTLLVSVGDSRADGAAWDEGNLVWTPDPKIKTLNAANELVQYAPGTITGIVGGLGTNSIHVGPEAEFARQLRAADPSRDVVIVKVGRSGSTQGSAQGAVNWSSGSVLMTDAKARLDAAKALLSGATSVETVVSVFCGINDANSTYRILYSAAARGMYANIKANWLTGSEKIIQFRDTYNNNSNTPLIRAAQQENAKDDARVYLANTDGFGKNADNDGIGTDFTHYNLAGITSCGAAAYAIYAGGAGLNLDLYSTDFTTGTDPRADFGFANLPVNGWSIAGGQLVGTAVPNFSVATLPGLIDEAAASYTITFDLVVTTGSARFQLIGGTTVTGTTHTTSGTKTQTVTAPAANAGNINFVLASAGAGFTGTVDNLVITRN